MSEDDAVTAALLKRVEALSGQDRLHLLAYLCGRHSRTVSQRLDEMQAGQRARARCETCGASGASEPLEKTTWTAMADGSQRVRWFCRDVRACNGRRFPELARMHGETGENCGGGR